jgi:hypothetical protein
VLLDQTQIVEWLVEVGTEGEDRREDEKKRCQAKGKEM